MLLWVVNPQFAVRKKSADLAGDIALETAHRFLHCLAFLRASFDVFAGSRVVDHAGDDDVPQRGVGLRITAAVEPMSLVLAATGLER
jgi:hypothetical protein